MDKKRKTVENIVLINPMLYGLQDAIEKQQDKIIADFAMPAAKAVSALIALDNRRIDICNLKVLYAFMERELGGKFALLVSCVNSGADTPLFERAYGRLECEGYTAERAEKEFGYLFKLIKKRRIKKVLPPKLVFADSIPRV